MQMDCSLSSCSYSTFSEASDLRASNQKSPRLLPLCLLHPPPSLAKTAATSLAVLSSCDLQVTVSITEGTTRDTTLERIIECHFQDSEYNCGFGDFGSVAVPLWTSAHHHRRASIPSPYWLPSLHRGSLCPYPWPRHYFPRLLSLCL